MKEGMLVRVLPPFDEAYPGTYLVVRVDTAEHGQQVMYLEGIESAFAPTYLEAAQ